MEATGKARRKWAGSAELTQLKGRFEQWRAGRERGTRIPPELWAEAVRMAAKLGAVRVCAELHLDYTILKRRAAHADGKSAAGAVAPHFVELFAPAGVTATTTRMHAPCVVEMDNARGAKMRVELSGDALGGLAALCGAFWAAR